MKTFRLCSAVLCVFFLGPTLDAQSRQTPLQPVPGQAPAAPAQTPPAEAPATPGPETPAAPAAPGETAPAPEAGETQEESLLLQTLELDIRTAGYYELLDWATRLGLSPRGTREDLQKLLYTHYGITPAAAAPAVAGETQPQVITIEAARNTEYFTLTATGERYIRLSGDVQLELSDPDSDAVHRIVAEEIIFNQTEDLFTARGNVEYVLRQGDREEHFVGESISFRIDTWEGAFFEGVTSRERTVETNELTFFFRGDSIVRSEEDVIAMADGDITSCNVEDSHFSIRAEKIWILAPGEWGLSRAILYVGRVPIFYFPFFFYPGNEMFFNPTFGYRNREGYYLQTTTYLIGERKRTDSSFSFLQLGEEEDSNNLKEREGLFLVRTDEEKPRDHRKDWYMKLMADMYSRLGSYLGIEGKLSGKKVLRSLDFNLGVGFSRTLYAGAVTFSPYYVDNQTGEISEHWNTSELFGLQVPFRYELGVGFSLNGERYSLTGKFTLFSDPFVQLDFRNRTENIDWGKLFKIDEDEGGTEESTGSTVAPSWLVSGNYRFDTTPVSPWLSSLSLSNIKSELSWLSKDVPAEDLEPFETAGNRFPGRSFFYPNVLTYPDYSISSGGTLFSSKPPVKPASETAGTATPDEGTGIKPPWDVPDKDGEPAESGAEAGSDGPVFRLPALRTDGTTAAGTEPLSFQLAYTLNHGFSHKSRTDPRDWISPEDIDFSFLYTSLETTNRLGFTGTLGVFEKLITSTLGIQIRGDYRTHYDESEFDDRTFTETTWKNLLLQDYSSSYFDVTSTFNLSWAPFLAFQPLSGSRISYTLNSPLYSYTYKELGADAEPVYESGYFEWTEEKIQAHSVSFNLSGEVFRKTQSLTLTAILPPEDASYTGTIDLKYLFLSGRVSSGVRDVEDDWIFQPVVLTGIIAPATNVSLTEVFTYDPEKEYWTSIQSTLGFRQLNASFNMKRLVPQRFNWDPQEYSWEPSGEEALIPSDLSVRYAYTHQSEPLWKNRLTYSLTVDGNWRMNLVRYTDSPLSLSLKAKFDLFEFLHLEFSSLSQNDAMYLYLPLPRELLPDAYRKNFFVDLLKSFNFFQADQRDRKDSNFKIRNVSARIVHSLHDWDLSLEYSGSPLRTLTGTSVQYVWNPVFSIFLQWKPIPEVKTEITGRRDPLTGETEWTY